jgi:hypothetical protein
MREDLGLESGALGPRETELGGLERSVPEPNAAEPLEGGGALTRALGRDDAGGPGASERSQAGLDASRIEGRGAALGRRLLSSGCME